MHTLIVGEPGVGKSTLIRWVLEQLAQPVSGYITVKETALEEPERGAPVYFYPMGRPRVQTEENLLSWSRCHDPQAAALVFDRFAPVLLGGKKKGILLMDEIGHMESRAEHFCAAVLTALDGDRPVLAAVKAKDTPFLCRVRSHPNCVCFHITRENREELKWEVLEFLRRQMWG